MKVTTYERAALLVKRIIAPSNQEAKPQEGAVGFNPDRSEPVYMMDFEGPSTTVVHKLLDELYHSRDRMAEFEPQDYRIGSNNELQADINELVRIFVYNKNTTFLGGLLESGKVSFEELDKALAVSTVYSGVSEAEFYFQYLRSQKYRFPENPWSKISGSGGLAENKPALAEKILGEILKAQERVFTYSGAFSQWTHSFRGQEWMFEKFIKRVNGFEATERTSAAGAPYASKKYTPALSGIQGLTIHDFPGSGVVIYGLHSKLFPDKYLSKTFLSGDSSNSIDYEYRKLIVEGEKSLEETTFAFFRGALLIYNPKSMKVNGLPHGLLVYNDHFPKDHKKTAFLVDGKTIERFVQNPYSAVNKANILHPETLLVNLEVSTKPINLASLAAQAGFCEEVQGFKDKKIDQKVKVHNEVTRAAMFAITQLDLIREAYRLYSLGYYYDKKKNNFYMDEFVMLRELLRVNRAAARQNLDSDKPAPELPVAFPFTFLNHSVDPVKVSKIGFIGANMTVYTSNPKGDFLLFEDQLSRITPDEISHISQDDMESMLGSEGLDYWRRFLEGNNLFRANPMIVDPVYKRIGSEILAANK